MRMTIFGLAVLVVPVAGPALADECRDRFVSYMKERIANPRAGVGRIISEPKGGKPSEGRMTFLVRDHYMYQPVDPPQGMWSLRWKNVRYVSMDGKAWKRAGPVDDAAETKAGIQVLTEEMNTAKNLACGEETIDGVKHVTFEYDFVTSSGYRTDMKNWVSSKTGLSTKSIMRMSGKGFESTTTQYWKPAEGETLPKPQ